MIDKLARVFSNVSNKMQIGYNVALVAFDHLFFSMCFQMRLLLLNWEGACIGDVAEQKPVLPLRCYACP